MSDKKKILVTGGAGFIGSHTVVALVENGYNPILVDDFRNSEKSVIAQLEEITQEKLIHYPIDCCDLSALRNVFENHSLEGVIHFAAYKSVGESVNNPTKYYHNNLLSLTHVLDLAKEFSVANIVFSSSCTVYGEPEGSVEVDENTPLQTPISPYGKTKLMAEWILADYHIAQPKSNIYALRYFNPIGAHHSGKIGELPLGIPDNLVPYITQTAANIRPSLTVFGKDYPTKDGTCERDFIHVEDLAEAHVAALKRLELEQGHFDFVNLGTGRGSSVQELIDTFEQVTGVKLSYSYGERRPGDITSIYANVAKSKKELNWEAKRSLETALASAWQWQKNLQKND